MIQSLSTTHGKHVIVVLDDDADLRNSLKFLLEIEGFEVRTYASPSELLDDSTLPVFSCLIIDYHMPAMNGLNVVTKLRERRNSVLAILITGHPNAKIRERAAAAGLPLVEKPFQGTSLIECVRTILDGHPKPS